MGKRRALLIVGGIVLGIFAVGAILVALLARTATRVSVSAKPVQTLDIRSERGSVTVLVGDGAVETREHWILSRPKVDTVQDGGTLTIRVTCPGWAFLSCSADVAVKVPAGTPTTAKAVRGNLTVVGLTGPLKAISEDGNVRVSGAPTSLEARSVTGTVDIDITSVPSVVRLRSETKDVTLTMPGGRYDLTARSARGRVDVAGITSSPDASPAVEATSGAGDVRVTGR